MPRMLKFTPGEQDGQVVIQFLLFSPSYDEQATEQRKQLPHNL
ncbi:hypothetical protein N8651_02955 [Akkermansiaceae bacterium]|nr:hypothetical protein [Akkermansiaceae bacterium]